MAALLKNEQMKRKELLKKKNMYIYNMLIQKIYVHICLKIRNVILKNMH